MNVTLTNDQYAALVALAWQGSTGDPYQLEEFLKLIEKQNNITRYFLAIRWQECNTPLPPNIREKYPEQWPPTQSSSLTRYDRPIARVDVEAEVNRLASNPVGIMVTRDPAATHGWTKIEDFFIT